MTNCVQLLGKIDPTEGLVDYVLDIKPYHTKIVEVIVEYVYTDLVDVTIIDKPEWVIHIERPAGPLYATCDDGYSLRPYGDPGIWPINSPNQAKRFYQYPAIDIASNTFIVTGDRTDSFFIGDTVTLVSYVEDFTNIYLILGVFTGTPSFRVNDISNTFDTAFSIGDNIEAFDTNTNNDKTFTITNIIHNVGDGTTLVEVAQSVNEDIHGGYLGLVRTIANNNGQFTITDVDYSYGSIDSWPDVSIPASYTLGDDPHTLITVSEPLVDPLLAFTPTTTRFYVAFAGINRIPFVGVLSYSNVLNRYDPTGPTLFQTPDEGLWYGDVISIDEATDTIVITGELSRSNVFEGSSFIIERPFDSELIYTIATETYDSINDTTTITTVEDIVDPMVVDSRFIIDIPANVFLIEGDYRERFTQGFVFEIVGGSASGQYTTLTADFVDDHTRVHTIEKVFDPYGGMIIHSILSSVAVVGGNVAGNYPAGQQFNIVGSIFNDGIYTVDVGGATYDSVAYTTSIPLVEQTIDQQRSGKIFKFVPGMVKETYLGFSEHADFCGGIPETLVRVAFDEYLVFKGLGLDLEDDVIAYNLENNDKWGFELPATTVVGATAPVIPEQATAPTSPTIMDFWYDTTNKQMTQWNGYEWNHVSRMWWSDTDNNMLYSRIKQEINGSTVDTGWVLDFNGEPGYSDIAPAVGETEFVGQELFFVADIGDYIPQTTFTLVNYTVPNTDPTLLKVCINNIPTDFILNSDSEFQIISPYPEIGDIVTADVFDRTATETNAYVTSWGREPHLKYHKQITVDAVNDAYVLGGGNFIEKFITDTVFATHVFSVPNTGSVEDQRALSFGVNWVDADTSTFNVIGDYTWLFDTGRIFRHSPSENNYHDYQIVSSAYNLTSNSTSIVVTQTPEDQLYYNPGVPVITIDDVSDSIIVNGNVVTAYLAGDVVQISGSTAANNVEWIVDYAVYDGGNDRTDVYVTGNIPDHDTSGFLHTQIFQNYSRDLGVIVGAIYDPIVDTADPTDQVKTYVAVNGTVSTVAEGLTYYWNGPIRFDIKSSSGDMISNYITDITSIAQEIISSTLQYNIVDTNAGSDWFRIEYSDPVLNVPVNMASSFTPGTQFDVRGSYYNDVAAPDYSSSNNGTWVVQQSYYDDPDLYYAATGGETLVQFQTMYASYNVFVNSVLQTEGVDYQIISPNTLCFGDVACGSIGAALSPGDIVVQVPVGVTSPLAQGSGDTYLYVEKDYDKIPPYIEFDVVSATNTFTDPRALNELTLTGDYVALFRSHIGGGKYEEQIGFTANQTTGIDPIYLSVVRYGIGTDDLMVFKQPLIATDNPIRMTVGVDYVESSQTSIRWTGTGETLDVGDTLYFYLNVPSRQYLLDQPIVNASNRHNFITVISVEADGGNTLLKVKEDFIDEAYTGALGMAFINFSTDIEHDDSTVVDSGRWVNGYVVTESVAAADPNANIAAALFQEELLFGWGGILRWVIADVDHTTDTVQLYGDFSNAILTNDTVKIKGSQDIDEEYDVVSVLYDVPTDLTAVVLSNPTIPSTPDTTFIHVTILDVSVASRQFIIDGEDNTHSSFLRPGETFDVVNSQGNDNTYTVATTTYDSLLDRITVTVIPGDSIPVDTSSGDVRYQKKLAGWLQLENIDITGWYQYKLLEANSTTNEFTVLGDATTDLQMNQEFRVFGTASNNDIYTVSNTPTFDGNNTAIPVASITVDEVGIGWIESARDYGIRMLFTDSLHMNTVENATSVVMTDGGSLVDAWDYVFWDVGAFDEDLGTAIHLYSSSS